MTDGKPGHPDPVTAAAENLAAAITQMVDASVAAALAGAHITRREPAFP